MLKRLEKTSREMEIAEGLFKLVLVVIILPIPILLFGLGGILLNMPNLLPIFVSFGTVVGTLISA
ncbi:unnamed protein product, partial [marine sediment metagenome]